MNRTRLRNILGCIVAFFLSLFFGIGGTVVMLLREQYQSEIYDIPLEKEDLVRYGLWGFLGSTVNWGILVWVIIKLAK